MEQAGISANDRKVAIVANEKAQITNAPATAIELQNGQIVTGKTSSLLGSSAAAILNALKILANIDDSISLISPEIIEPIQNLKVKHFGNRNPRLHIDETLIALSMSAVTSDYAKKVMECLPLLKGLEAHSSVILSQTDDSVFKKLGIHLTCEPVYQTKKLYHG